MQRSPLISVIVPAYNVERYLDRCIDSILRQTYKKYEVIIVDDGATDSTGKIADKISTENEEVRCIHKKNAGLGEARNTGILNASGAYVTFVDSDDYIEPDFIEKSLELIQKEKADTVITSYYRVNSKKKKIVARNSNTELLSNKSIHDNLIPRLLGSLPEKKDTFAMSAWGILYDLSIIKNNDIKFVSERIVGSEDTMFNMEYLSHSSGTVLTEYAGYNYCDNENSLTTSYNPKRFSLHKELYRQELTLITRLKLPKNTILRLDWQLFIHLKMAIKQEVNYYGLFSIHTIANTRKLIEDPLVNEVVQNYPMNRMDYKHRLFLKMLKRKNILLLCLMVCIKG